MRDDVHPSIDYLTRYMTPTGLDVPRLLNDDFFEAIRLLFNSRKFVSSLKLLLSFVDTMAFLETGESSGSSFQRWLDTYVDLSLVGATSQELWEHRNSLLHMTNLDSRRVASGRVRRLLSYVGELPVGVPAETADSKFFSFKRLISAIGEGVRKFLGQLNADPAKLKLFLERYDLIVSDHRQMVFTTTDEV
jgi:hypothetical protein